MIRVTSTALNVGELAYYCVRSVVEQTYRDWTLDFFDAASDDDTHNQASRAAGCRGQVGQTIIEREYARTGALDKLIPLWRSFDDDDIIVWLDGDDRLGNNKALETVAGIHARGFVCTYGTFMLTDGTVIHNGHVGPCPRAETWRASHLKTFRAGAFKRIKDKDLRDVDGRYYSLAIDQAVMLPILEMFPNKSGCIAAVMYVYNLDTSFEKNATEDQKAEERRVVARIRASPVYRRQTW